MKTWFPINFEKIRGIPINSHPGAFGCARRYNFHEGIDLYGKPGDWVYAIRDGEVISNKPFTGASVGFGWWLETDALLIQDEDGFYVYGEIKSELKPGDKVKAGQKIAELVPVLPPEKFRPDIPGHSVTMLHLERYSNDYDTAFEWSSWEHRDLRPPYLQDPTNDLIKTLTYKKKPVKLLTL
jgi:hypothetical protein